MSGKSGFGLRNEWGEGDCKNMNRVSTDDMTEETGSSCI